MSVRWWQDECRVPDETARASAMQRNARLTKPAGALGRLEWVVQTLAGLQGRERPSLERIWITVFAGDHGVAHEGVSAYPQSVTAQMLANFVEGGAAISVLAGQLGARLEVIDLGTVAALHPLPGVRHVALGAGTRNFTQGAAMSADVCEQALRAGHDSVIRACDAGTDLFIGGEMGIGNTTTAAALACALLGPRRTGWWAPGPAWTSAASRTSVPSSSVRWYAMPAHTTRSAGCSGSVASRSPRSLAPISPVRSKAWWRWWTASFAAWRRFAQCG